MHLLGTSVLMVILLPLAFSCESDNIKSKIAAEYNNIIRTQLKSVEASIDLLKSDCTDVVNTQGNNKAPIEKKLCRLSEKLKKVRRESKNMTEQLKLVFNNFVENISETLRCLCTQKKRRPEPTGRARQWKICKVKHILEILQTYFEEYNASL